MIENLKQDKLYYSISELAKAYNVNSSLIRYWDKEFEILKPKKNSKGNRIFSNDDVKNFDLIYHLLKTRGFTIEGAKIHLKENSKKVMEKHEIILKLTSIKNELIALKESLD